MMIELTLLMPQDKDPHPMKEEDFFLWQAEAAVLEDAPEPSEADAQEIVFYPEEKAGLLRLLFNTKEPALQDRVAGFATRFTPSTAQTDCALSPTEFWRGRHHMWTPHGRLACP